MPLSEKIDDYIASLPAEYQPSATQLREYLRDAATDKLSEFFASLLAGDIIAAFRLVVPGLSAEETAAEVDQVAEDLLDLNAANADQIERLRSIAVNIVAMVVQAAAAVI